MTTRRTINLVTEPTGFAYESLLRQLASVAEYVGLIVRSARVQLAPNAQALLSSLSRFLVREEEVMRWPGTELVGQRTSRRYLYRLTPESLVLLIEAANGLFDWVNPALPEDLHLLRTDETTVLGSVAQEEDGWLELDDTELGKLKRGSPEEVLALLTDGY